ncbi:MAG: hypothetical protein ACJ711_14835, partial [Ornithinibacter sp.]
MAALATTSALAGRGVLRLSAPAATGRAGRGDGTARRLQGAAGHTVLVTAHGNSLRALVKHL